VLFISIGKYLSWSNTANLHSICPFGGVVNLYTFFSSGNYVAKLHQATFILLIALIAGLILTGKSFCGWICPLGSVQEWLGKVGRKLFPRIYDKLPHKLSYVLGFAKYLILIWVVYQTALTAKLFFEPWGPYWNLFNIWTSEIAISGYVVTGLTLFFSLFVERPFCRFACPLGAINGLTNSFSLLNIKREEKTCIHCDRCDKVCPMKIVVSKQTTVDNIECIRCLRCTEICPVNATTGSTLKLRGLGDRPDGKRKAVPKVAYLSIALGAFFLPILIAVVGGNFITERPSIYTTVEDIKGSSPLQDIFDNFPVSKEEFYRGFGLPDSIPPATLLKDVGPLMGIPKEEEIIAPTVVREAIRQIDGTIEQLAQAGVVKPEEVLTLASKAGLIPSSPARQLWSKGEPGTIAYVLSGLWPKDFQGPGGIPTPSASPTPSIKGTTTLSELQELFPHRFAAVLSQFGIPADAPLTSALKDLGAQYGFEVTAVRDFLELGTSTPTSSSSPSATPSSTSPNPTTTPSTTVKGTTTLEEIKTMLGSRYAEFLTQFGISSDEPTTVILKDLGAKYGFEVTAIRDYIVALPTP
jgi:Pyruvate/2-oxoacid:ferredoxin oxidoreductase delta subunit